MAGLTGQYRKPRGQNVLCGIDVRVIGVRWSATTRPALIATLSRKTGAWRRFSSHSVDKLVSLFCIESASC